MFKISPKQTGDKKDAERILKEEKIGRLGVTAGNYPYVVPLCYVYHREAVYFHSNKKGLKLESIKQNNQVCFQVDRVSEVRVSYSPCEYGISYHSVIIFGRAEEVHDPQEKTTALNLLTEAFTGGEKTGEMEEREIEEVAVIKIAVDKMTAKINLG